MIWILNPGKNQIFSSTL